MSDIAASKHALRVSDLSASRRVKIDLRLDQAELNDLCTDLSLLDLRKVTLNGTLAPFGKSDWKLAAQLGATVVQPCVATLAPVTTRVEAEVQRVFLRDYIDPESPETEMPEDDHIDALGTFIDPLAILAEALSLELPLYPRADGSETVEIRVTEPGKQPMTDEQAKPFAGLASLKDQLKASQED